MRSRVLVVLQFALILAVAMPVGPFAWPPPAIGIALGALALGAWSLATNRPGNFNVRPEPKAGGRLVTTGAYRFVRHPMYLALLVFALACALGYAQPWRWAAAFALALVLHMKAGVEEAGLRAVHTDYADYARRTPRLLPFLRLPPPFG
jgi:protein-S-isoprenylcysteine O-methyltransferase Ste14